MPAAYPRTRLRRLRRSDWSRRLVQEHEWSVNDLIWPVFVVDGENQQIPVASLPGVERYSIDCLVEKAKEAEALGIPCIALFPAIDPTLKSEDAKEAFNPNNLACRAIQAVKAACPNLGIMVDVALDLYTSHGHDGLVIKGEVANDETVEALVKQSLVYAEAGVDALGPSDMMDGRIGAIRDALEDKQFKDVCLISYAAKYCSALYGPYRDAVGSKGHLGKSSKSSYQQDPANRLEALRECELDLNEGADALMVKPGSLYLDVIRSIKDELKAPVFAYQVSGEYAMVKAAEANGWIDGPRVLSETLTAFKRAGCDAVISYASLDLAKTFN